MLVQRIDQISGILPDWEQVESINQLPRPNNTDNYCGWKLGVIIRQQLLISTYIHHAQYGAWKYYFSPVLPEPDRAKRFERAIAAVDLIKAQIGTEIEDEDSTTISKNLEIAGEAVTIRPIHETQLALDDIRVDGDTQRRVQIDPNTVDEYTASLLQGAKLPPLKLVYDGDYFWLYDGFHTRKALINIEADYALCQVVHGTLDLAQDLALGVNADHGLKRSNADKFATVAWSVQQPRHASKSNEAIAKLCKVSAPFVSSVRQRLGLGQAEREVTRNGQTYTMRTNNLGRRSLQEVQDLYEPWGELSRCWNPTHPLELRQRGRLIKNFRSINDAWDQHSAVTAQMIKLADLPPGPHRCTTCVHRTPTGETWYCGAKSPNNTYALDFDWAESNNGDCRLFQPIEFPTIHDGDSFNVADYVEPNRLTAPAQEPETYTTADYIAEEAEYQGKSSNEKYTPPNWINFVTQVFGRAIDLDPASCAEANTIVQAQRYYTIEQNAVELDWQAETLFLNPPYSMPEVEQFSIKLLAELTNIGEFIFLVNSCTETSWFQAVANQCDLLLFPASRINFWSPGSDPHNIKGANEYRQTLMYRGPNRDRFTELGQKLGLVVSINHN